MPGYFPKELKLLVHETPQKLQDQHNPYAPPNYVSKLQHAKAIDNFHPLSKGDIKKIIQVTGNFLFYARAINSTMIPDLSTIASE